jgi:hypothetical protein
MKWIKNYNLFYLNEGLDIDRYKEFSESDYLSKDSFPEREDIINKYNLLLKNFKISSKNFLDEMKSLNQMVYELIRMRKMIDPPVYIAKFREKNGSLCYHAKMNWFDEKGIRKAISVYIGKADLYPNEEEAIKIGKSKIRDKILKLYY